MPVPPFHRPPRHPHAWLWALLVSQWLVAALWWRFGWQIGLPCMFASHLPFWWGVLWPQSRLYSPVLIRLPLAQDDRRVWLTIDDGPSEQTRALLDLLDAHGAKATFFLVGDRAAQRPDDVREIARRGHGIGNHSASHPQAWFWALGPRRMADEIARTQVTLREITGSAPHWFRAVVGMANPFVSAPLKRLGLARVAWNARGYDGVGAAPSQVVARIEKDLAPGAIVLLHEAGAATRSVATLELLLQRMRAGGWSTVLPEHL
jgi:peptidoglycan/xylan/chitin deacetylase (PgdA/CDA1 family)